MGGRSVEEEEEEDMKEGGVWKRREECGRGREEGRHEGGRSVEEEEEEGGGEGRHEGGRSVEEEEEEEDEEKEEEKEEEKKRPIRVTGIRTSQVSKCCCLSTSAIAFIFER